MLLLKKHLSVGVIGGLSLTLVLTFIVSVLLTVLIQNGVIGERSVQGFCFAGQLLSCAIGFVVVGATCDTKVAIHVGICSMLYVVVISIVGLALSNDGLQNWSQIILSSIIGALIACAICIRKPKRKKYRKQAYR